MDLLQHLENPLPDEFASVLVQFTEHVDEGDPLLEVDVFLAQDTVLSLNISL